MEKEKEEERIRSTWIGYYSSPDDKKTTTRDTEVFARYI